MEEENRNGISNNRHDWQTSTSTDNEVNANKTAIKRTVDMIEKCNNKPMKAPLTSIRDYEKQWLRIPMAKFYFCQKDKRKVPFEAMLLRSLARLPRQMIRSLYLGQGNILERIDEYPLEETLNEDDKKGIERSNELGHTTDMEDILGHQQLYRMRPMPENDKVLSSIPERSRLDEQNIPFALNISQRRIIPSNKTWLKSILEVSRFHEMAEEEPVEDEDEIDARIWMSNSSVFY